MRYYVIQNGEIPHYRELKKLLTRSDDALIVSPFLSNEAVEMLGKCFTSKLKHLTLVTTLKPLDFDQVKKAPVLQRLYLLCESNSVALSILVDNRLHGKVYVGKKDEKYIGAIVSSANLTENGLLKNHEWGVFIDDSKAIRRMSEQILSGVECEIDKQTLAEMLRLIKEHKFSVDMSRPKMKLDLLDVVRPSHIVGGNNVTFWLKPFGTIDYPVPEASVFDEELFNVTFARGVGSINEGDVMVAYAVKSRKILSVFVATSSKGRLSVFPNKRDEHWPFYVSCINKTPQFGAHWSEIGLTLDTLVASFLQLDPTKEIRPGSKTLSAIRWGHDRLRLNKDFTEYIINKVFERQKAYVK